MPKEIANEMRQNPTLSLDPVQLQVIAALLTGQTITAAAESAGVHRATVHNWMNNPVFASEYDRIRQEIAFAIHDQLQELEALALNNLRQILTDPKASPSVRLRASLAILNRPADPLKAWSVPVPPALAPAVSRPPKFEEQDQHQIPRNAPCPCGSGEKYKRCCGDGAPPVLGKRVA